MEQPLKHILFVSLLMLMALSCDRPIKNKLLKERKAIIDLATPNLELYPSMNYHKEIWRLQKSGKPILVYFNAIACVNCRKLEKMISSSKELQEDLNENFEVLNLYVDDRKLLGQSEWILREGNYLKTIGSINNYIQIDKTKSGSQPILAILDAEENVIDQVGYLDENGLKKFISRNK